MPQKDHFIGRFAPGIAAMRPTPSTPPFLAVLDAISGRVAGIAVVLRAERRDPLLWLGLGGGAMLGAMTRAATLPTTDCIAAAYPSCTSVAASVAFAVSAQHQLPRATVASS